MKTAFNHQIAILVLFLLALTFNGCSGESSDTAGDTGSNPNENTDMFGFDLSDVRLEIPV